MNLKIPAIIIVLLVMILSPGIVKAGVVIEQRITGGPPNAPGPVSNRTLILQGDKEKFQIDDHVSMVIDADARIVTVLDSGHKTFRELPLKNVIGVNRDPNRILYTAFKSTDKTRELLGFKCRDYTGTSYSPPLIGVTTACFSTEASGADDFNHFMQSLFRRSSRLKGLTSFPAGVPLIIESTHTVNLALVPKDIPKEEAIRFKNRIASIPPTVMRVEVTKITSEKLPPDVFNVPAGYTRWGRALD